MNLLVLITVQILLNDISDIFKPHLLHQTVKWADRRYPTYQAMHDTKNLVSNELLVLLIT